MHIRNSINILSLFPYAQLSPHARSRILSNSISVMYYTGPGPFTLFAPTDDAFATLPPGYVDSLLLNTTVLTGIRVEVHGTETHRFPVCCLCMLRLQFKL